MTRALALLLTIATGFSGLVYEVAWQKYLATLLGSQVITMGGGQFDCHLGAFRRT